jgi:hypothetical protein
VTADEIPFFIHLPSTEAAPHPIFSSGGERLALFDALLQQFMTAGIPIVLATQSWNAGRIAKVPAIAGCHQFYTARMSLFLALEEYAGTAKWQYIGIYPSTGCLLGREEWHVLCQEMNGSIDSIVPAASHIGVLPLVMSTRAIEALSSSGFAPYNYNQLAPGIRGVASSIGLAVRIYGVDTPGSSALVDNAPAVRAMLRVLDKERCPANGLTARSLFLRELSVELWEASVTETIESPVIEAETRPRMLMVCDSQAISGAELNFIELASELQRTPIAPIVLGRPGTQIASRCALEGVPFVGWNYSCDKPSRYAARVLEHLIGKCHIKALYSNGPIAHSVFVAAAEHHIPHVYHVRGYNFLNNADWLSLASRVICPSEFIARAAERAGIHPSRILVVKNGLRFRDTGEESVSRDLKQRTILNVGWIAPEKRQHVLLEESGKESGESGGNRGTVHLFPISRETTASRGTSLPDGSSGESRGGWCCASRHPARS